MAATRGISRGVSALSELYAHALGSAPLSMLPKAAQMTWSDMISGARRKKNRVLSVNIKQILSKRQDEGA